MATNKPEQIIIISTPSALVNSFLERLQRSQDVDIIMMLETPRRQVSPIILFPLEKRRRLSGIWSVGMKT